MAIRRKKGKGENGSSKEEAKSEVDVAREVVVDMEAVRNAIKLCLDFEKEKGISLINPKGKSDFAQMYRKYESQNRVKQMVIDTVKEEVKRQIDPVDKKLNTLLDMMCEKAEKTKEIKPEKKPEKKTPISSQELDKKIDSM